MLRHTGDTFSKVERQFYSTVAECRHGSWVTGDAKRNKTEEKWPCCLLIDLALTL